MVKLKTEGLREYQENTITTCISEKWFISYQINNVIVWKNVTKTSSSSQPVQCVQFENSVDVC